MGMFRSVTLPSDIAGALFLHAMPGRWEPLDATWAAIVEQRIDCLISLAPRDEVREKSPTYADAITSARVPCPRLEFPVVDYGAPGDRAAFRAFAHDLAARLRLGHRLLIHCGAGIGRTGTLAVCVLLALGQRCSQAQRAVSAAGSRPETPGQRDLVDWCASHGPAPP